MPTQSFAGYAKNITVVTVNGVVLLKMGVGSVRSKMLEAVAWISHNLGADKAKSFTTAGSALLRSCCLTKGKNSARQLDVVLNDKR